MKNVKYLVIGAGISGLSFAHFKRDNDYIVVEKESEIGGLCRSFFDKGFVWDVAGHFFHFHSDETRQYFMHLIQAKKLHEVVKCAKVRYQARTVDAPFQYNIHQLPVDEFLECLTSLYYAHVDGNAETFEDYVKSKYGAGIASKFLIPYNEKLYACSMNELDKDSMGQFLPKLDFGKLMEYYQGNQEKTYNDVFLYPAGGCVEFVEALYSDLDSTRIHLNETVQKIITEEKRLYTNKECYHYEYLINTTPLNVFSHLVGDDSLNSLSFNKILVLNLGFDKASTDTSVSWMYFPGAEVFYRVGFYNNITHTDALSLYVEISFRKDETVDVNTSLSQTMLELKRAGIINDHKLVAYNSYIINPGYAHITKDGKKAVEKFIGTMSDNSVYCIGRYARWEYSAMDDSIEQAKSLSETI